MKHRIHDTDAHFVIDRITRQMTNTASQKITLIRGDHNSERFTFELPREIEGHDMSLCDQVRVHFINIDSNTKMTSTGVYEPDDFQVCPDDEKVVICSWLISKDATQYVGALNFTVSFSCVDGEKVLYRWNTAIHTNITVSDGINSGEIIVDDYIDILTNWKNQLEANQITSITQTKTSQEDNGENIWTALFGDGRTSDFVVRNGSRGATGLIGSIETINGEPLHFFVGEKAEYEAFPDEIKQMKNLLALFTDDDARDTVLDSIAFFNKLISLTDTSTLTRVPRMFSELSETGLVTVPVDGTAAYEIADIFEKMPKNSSIGFTVNTAEGQHQEVYPSGLPIECADSEGNHYGMCLLIKGWTANYCFALWFDRKGDLYVYRNTPEVKGWHKVYTAKDESVPKADELTLPRTQVNFRIKSTGEWSFELYSSMVVKRKFASKTMTASEFKEMFMEEYDVNSYLPVTGMLTHKNPVAAGQSQDNIVAIYHNGTKVLYRCVYLATGEYQSYYLDNCEISEISTSYIPLTYES